MCRTCAETFHHNTQRFYRLMKGACLMNLHLHKFAFVEVMKAKYNFQSCLWMIWFATVCRRVTNVFNLPRWQSQFSPAFMKSHLLSLHLSWTQSGLATHKVSINLSRAIRVWRLSPDIDVVFYGACNDAEVNRCVWLTSEMSLRGGSAPAFWRDLLLTSTAQPHRDAGGWRVWCV